MKYREMEQRLARLEDQAPLEGEHTYVADIGSAIARYWIDGREVSAHEFSRWAPTDYTVDIGDEE